MTAFTPNKAGPNDIRELYYHTYKELQRVGGAITAAKPSASAPATASDTGTPGQTAYDADYFYVCVATDTWKRVAIATW